MSFLRSSFFIFSQDVFVTGLSFLSSIVLARWLGPEQLGLYYIVSLIPIYSEKFGRVGNFDHAGVYFIKMKRYALRDVVSHVAYISLFTSLFPILLFLLFKNQFYAYVVKDSPIPFFYVGTALVAIPFTTIAISYQKLFAGEGKVGTYNTLRILNPLITFIGVIIFYLMGWNYYGVILAGLVAAVLTAIYGTFQMNRLVPFSLQINAQLIKELFGYGWKIYFITLIYFFHLRADLFFVALFLEPSSVTYYGMAVTIGQMVWKVPNAISVMLFPKVASQKEKPAAEFTARVCRISFTFLLFIGLIVTLVATIAVKILYGEEFAPLVAPLRYILPGILVMGMGRLLMEHFYGQGHPRGIVGAMAVTTIINIGLNWVIIPKYGISGAALVSSGTYILFSLWLIVEFSKRWGLSFMDFFILKKEDIHLIKDRISAFIANRMNAK